MVNTPEAVAPGLNEGAGAARSSPEHEEQKVPPARLPRSVSDHSKTLPPSQEAKPADFERTKVGVCKLSSSAAAQANSALRRESLQSFPCNPGPGAGAGGQAAIPHCKIPALQSADGDAALSLGKGSLEHNSAWVTLSQSTVVLGTDGNTSVLPGRVEGVSALLTASPCPAAAPGFGVLPLQHRCGVEVLRSVLKSGADGSGVRLGAKEGKKGREGFRCGARDVTARVIPAGS